MVHLDLVELSPLMACSSGSQEIVVGLLDGPVAINHPQLAVDCIRGVHGNTGNTCGQANSLACIHGTFIAGVLSARRGSAAPAICPNCTLLVHPIFSEGTSAGIPNATSEELAAAIVECIEAGARVLNLSLGLAQPSMKGTSILKEALNYAARQGVIVVAAAGNQGTLGGSVITRHPWVIPVVAYGLKGVPLNYSNLGHSIGRQGVGAPGEDITSLGSEGAILTMSGTSAAVPFVTGAIALLWSEFPAASAAEIKLAVTRRYVSRPAMVAPPLFNAWRAYQFLKASNTRR